MPGLFKIQSMPLAKNVKYIVVHCTAGFGDVESIQRYWREHLGWKSPGYHRIIDLEEKVHVLADYLEITNGVKGFNHEAINLAYTGGVDPLNITQAKDTRTKFQRVELLNEIINAKKWIHENGGNVYEVLILGHRDFSRDLNANNIIEPWERIKECPSFEARFEYTFLNPQQITAKLPI